jgi:hypothetical protein
VAERPLLRAGLHGLFATLWTIAIALALGAVWSALVRHVPSAMTWFALPVGIILGYVIGAFVTGSRALAMLLAPGGTLLAAIYMQCLIMALRLAAVMGLGFLPTLRTAGPAMLLALARNAWDARMVIACLIGMLLAFFVAGWRAPGRALRRPAS